MTDRRREAGRRIEDYHGHYREYLAESSDIDDPRRRCFADLAADAGRSCRLGRSIVDEYGAVRDQIGVELLSGVPETLESLEEGARSP
ncbi:hypothetical protein AB7C87_09985 [Natrarchaeobius sp. A-rgal3]|uniref:hypothetical protein n=1 Tax=Natrarchaeobius versutus TaxID=1679078 RepID=UPI00350F6675